MIVLEAPTMGAGSVTRFSPGRLESKNVGTWDRFVIVFFVSSSDG